MAFKYKECTPKYQKIFMEWLMSGSTGIMNIGPTRYNPMQIGSPLPETVQLIDVEDFKKYMTPSQLKRYEFIEEVNSRKVNSTNVYNY